MRRVLATAVAAVVVFAACGGGGSPREAIEVPQEFRDAVTVTSVAEGVSVPRAELEAAFEEELYRYFSDSDEVSLSGGTPRAPVVLAIEPLSNLREAEPSGVAEAMEHATVAVTSRFEDELKGAEPAGKADPDYGEPCCSVAIAYGPDLGGTVEMQARFSDQVDSQEPCCNVTQVTMPSGEVIGPEDATGQGIESDDQTGGDGAAASPAPDADSGGTTVPERGGDEQDDDGGIGSTPPREGGDPGDEEDGGGGSTPPREGGYPGDEEDGGGGSTPPRER